MPSEEEYEILFNYFSEDGVDRMFDSLPQETLDEILQVIQLVDKRINGYKLRIRELEQK